MLKMCHQCQLLAIAHAMTPTIFLKMQQVDVPPQNFCGICINMHVSFRVVHEISSLVGKLLHAKIYYWQEMLRKSFFLVVVLKHYYCYCYYCCCCCVWQPCHERVSNAYRITSFGSDTKTERAGSAKPRRWSCCAAALVEHSYNQCSRVCVGLHHLCDRLSPPKNPWCCDMRHGYSNDRYEVGPAAAVYSIYFWTLFNQHISLQITAG